MWKIWYDNGTAYSSDEGAPENAPGRGVMCIMQDDERTGRARIGGADYYIWREGRWFGVDLFGLWDYLADRGKKIVKFGRFVDREQFEKMLRMADADDSFPPRSGWLKTEHKV